MNAGLLSINFANFLKISDIPKAVAPPINNATRAIAPHTINGITAFLFRPQ